MNVNNDKQDGIEIMIMEEINLSKTPSVQSKSEHHEHRQEDTALPEMINTVNSLSSSDMSGHDRNQTFVINLNGDNNKLTEENENENENENKRNEEEDDDENGDEVITKSKTNTFDYRAQRLREMHELFFGDHFKSTVSRNKKRRHRMKKEDSKNKKLMGKRIQTDFDIINDTNDDLNDSDRVDHSENPKQLFCKLCVV